MACPKGQYFCNDEQMCKSIPAGHKVLKSGELVKEDLKKQIGNELENLTKSKTFNSFKKDALQIKGTLEKSAEKFNQSDFKNQIKDIGTNFANTAIDQLTRAAKKKVNSFGEGAYEGGGTIINPSGLRNKWGIPPLKSGGDGTTAGSDPIEVLRRMRDLGGASAKKKVNPKKNPIISSYKPEGKLIEETQGGINIETYTDGIQFNEIETINIIEPPKIKSPSYMTFIEDIKEETK